MENRFCVIGGQHEYVCYGGAPTYTGAKRMAAKNTERWDNRRGICRPAIHKAEDTTEIDISFGRGHSGRMTIRVPKFDVQPMAGRRK